MNKFIYLFVFVFISSFFSFVVAQNKITLQTTVNNIIHVRANATTLYASDYNNIYVYQYNPDSSGVWSATRTTLTNIGNIKYSIFDGTYVWMISSNNNIYMLNSGGVVAQANNLGGTLVSMCSAVIGLLHFLIFLKVMSLIVGYYSCLYV